jgi:hypothetical protein
LNPRPSGPQPLRLGSWRRFKAHVGTGDGRGGKRTRLLPPLPFLIDHVVFLGATAGRSVSRSCTLPAGTSILVPLINIECSSLEPPPFFGATPAERRTCAEGFADAFTALS